MEGFPPKQTLGLYFYLLCVRLSYYIALTLSASYPYHESTATNHVCENITAFGTSHQPRVVVALVYICLRNYTHNTNIINNL